MSGDYDPIPDLAELMTSLQMAQSANALGSRSRVVLERLQSGLELSSWNSPREVQQALSTHLTVLGPGARP